MAAILVSDAEQRSALAVVRSLGRAGHTVRVCSHWQKPLAGASRYARSAVVVPDPLEQPQAYVAALREQVERGKIDVLLPVTEASLLAVLPERERMGAALPFPSFSAFERICNKAEVAEAARRVGIGAPLQIRLEQPGDRTRLQERELEFPLVLKPARSVFGLNGGRRKQSVRHVRDINALNVLLGALPPEAYPVLLQQPIFGPGVGVFLLLDAGELLGAFAHRRIREKPPWGGVSVYRESIALDPELLGASVSLLRQFDWQGAAMVEFKVDERTGIPYIMEINGRFWGSLQLAIDAGVDFPALLIDAITGGKPEPVLSYRHGVRSRWFWGDVDHLLLRLRGTDPAFGSNMAEGGRARAVVDFLKAFSPTSRNEILRLSDPYPALRESVNWFQGR